MQAWGTRLGPGGPTAGTTTVLLPEMRADKDDGGMEMAKWYMVTAPRGAEEWTAGLWYIWIDKERGFYSEIPFPYKQNDMTKRDWETVIEENDCKRWIIAMETGKGGYEHWQVRLESSNPDFFNWMKEHYPKAHVEEAEVQEFGYERKEGRFWTSEDTTEIRICRFGEFKPWQKQLQKILRKQSVRQIDVVLDTQGNKGKTFFTIALWERGEALVVPRYSCTPEKLSAFVCSAYNGESVVIIDIPRAGKPTEALYETMEEVKDGLVFDPRYSGKTRNIRGVRMVVFTNHELKLKLLSNDRWKLHGIDKNGNLTGRGRRAFLVTLAARLSPFRGRGGRFNRFQSRRRTLPLPPVALALSQVRQGGRGRFNHRGT